jgi:hypothetical protein
LRQPILHRLALVQGRQSGGSYRAPGGENPSHPKIARRSDTQEAYMDAEAQAQLAVQLAAIIALLVELRDRLDALAEQLGVEF